MTAYGFSFRTGKVIIDQAKCCTCDSYACVKGCSLFGANIYRIEDGVPVLIGDCEETARRCIEDLSCELYCQAYGNNGLKIVLDMFGLDEYRQRMGLS